MRHLWNSENVVIAMLDEQQDRTLRFLCEAATRYAILAPAVSRSLGRRLRTQAKSSKVVLHPSTEQLFCPKCSQAYVPGSNCRVSTRRRKKKRRKKKKERKSSKEAPSPKPLTSKGGKGSGEKGAVETREGKTESKAKTRATKYVQYSCGVCRHRRRIPLPHRKQKRVAQGPGAGNSGAFRTVAQKKQDAALQEAKNAARAAKRQKAKVKAAAAASAEIEATPPMPASAPGAGKEEVTKIRTLDEKAHSQRPIEPTAVVLQPKADEPSVLVAPEAPRKRKREDKMSRVMNQLSNQRATSSSGFEFWPAAVRQKRWWVSASMDFVSLGTLGVLLVCSISMLDQRWKYVKPTGALRRLFHWSAGPVSRTSQTWCRAVQECCFKSSQLWKRHGLLNQNNNKKPEKTTCRK